ncbi:MAG: hypothetical protein ACK54H_09960 [Phycisphaerales bacterium]
MKREDDANPPSISEERLLDWIDGSLSERERRHLEMSCGPEVAAAVARMRADREAIRTISSVRAPDDLHDRMMEVFEREALLAPSSDPIPISRLKVNVQGSSMRGSPAVPLALAAGLLLMVSGGVYLLLGDTKGASTGSETGAYAVATQDQFAPIMEEPPVVMRDVVPAEQDAIQIESAQATAAPIEVGGVERTPMTEERILRLAREGRVVMRVVGDDLDQLEKLKADGAKPRYGRDWRLRGGVSQELAKAVEPNGLPFGLNHPDEFAFASGEAIGMIGPRAALNWPMAAFTDRASKVRATWIADVPMTQSALKAFRAVMSDQLDAKVVFEELESPVDVPPSLEPTETIWWTRGSSRWIDRVSMPVVIEER